MTASRYTNMAIDTGPFKSVFPLENGDFHFHVDLYTRG